MPEGQGKNMASSRATASNAPAIKIDYNTLRAPSNYVPGLGRGATGFTTRSDIGPARAAPDMSTALAGLGRGGGGKKEGDDDKGGDEKAEAENKTFDAFLGNDTGALAGNAAEYDDDDREADDVWDKIEDTMDERRREKREARLKEELEKYRADNPKITEQFADLKRKLSDISYDEWDAIPDIGDYTIKKQQRMQSFVPVPDSLLAKAVAEKEQLSAIDAARMQTPGGVSTGGLETPAAVADLTAVGEGRGTVLGLQLDRMADSVSGQTVVDPKGYMTDLKSMKITSDAEISDIKKARLLLKSVIQTNPNHAPGWIAAARLEELAGKVSAARQFVQKGCELCPQNEDVWLESARLQTPENAKAVLARGVTAIPTSVKLWMQASRLEQDDTAKSRVLRKALERVPNSVRLWKAAVELASEDDARVLLARAVECCPQHVELWLALARLENYENARKVLNKARETIPTDAAIWITAAKLEEAHGNDHMVPKIITRAIKSLSAHGTVIEREQWISEAEAAERAGSTGTCQSIVRASIGLGVEDVDRKRTWMGDADECVKRGAIQTARAIYAHALSVLPGKKSLWIRAAQLEKAHGTREALDELLKKAVSYCPQAEILWLMAAKEKWLAGDVPSSRAILQEAFASNPQSEEIWLAAFKLEFENSEPERARLLIAKAREQGGTERMWLKSAIVERELKATDQERAILKQGIKAHPAFFKLWLMLGQLEEREGNVDEARRVLTSGLGRCMTAVPLWKYAAGLEERCGNVSKARALLEQARLKVKQSDVLWLAAVRTELRAENTKAAEALMAKALQECPTSGLLWAEHVSMAPRPQRKSKSVDALKRCDNDPHIIAAVANLFWLDRKVDKARNWFNRAVTLQPDNGDFWANYLKFEQQHGTEEQRAAVVARCVAAEPHHGERWCRVSKNVANAHDSVEVLLRKTVVDLDKLPPP